MKDEAENVIELQMPFFSFAVASLDKNVIIKLTLKRYYISCKADIFQILFLQCKYNQCSLLCDGEQDCLLEVLDLELCQHLITTQVYIVKRY